ncbi:hypothetical protein [Variovorax sp. KK3]|uniref:hypothetical protein n=1 Tax=Variovorax sp. KK3 TaxID=1855728 RepID=UPI00117D4AC5|nr:hypothetical protein [Variovorax sp. KK3]
MIEKNCLYIALLSMLLSSSGHALVGGESSCVDDPRAQAISAFGRLETSKSPPSLNTTYNEIFTKNFKRANSEQDFTAAMTGLQKQFDAGPLQSRQFEARVLGPPQAIAIPPNERPNQGRFFPIEGSWDPNTAMTAINVEFLTSSPVGKMRHQAVMKCEEGQWKVEGFRYQPY